MTAAFKKIILTETLASLYEADGKRQQAIRGPFPKFVDWRQCAAVMKREAVTVIPSCIGGGNVVVV
jgi:hypothetical protein